MKIDIKDFSKLERGFVDIPKACAMALKGTFNIQAALTRKNAITRLSGDFILRNDFTVKSIAYDRCKTDDIPTMRAVTGALKRAAYLKLLHEGGARKAKAMFKNVAIAQNAARGGNKKRLVKESFYLQFINERRVTRRSKFTKVKFKSKKAQTVARAFIANREKLFMKYKEGFYTVTSFSKLQKRVKFKMKHIYQIPKKTPMIRKNSWLWDSAQKPAADGQAIFNSQAKKLLAQKKII